MRNEIFVSGSPSSCGSWRLRIWYLYMSRSLFITHPIVETHSNLFKLFFSKIHYPFSRSSLLIHHINSSSVSFRPHFWFQSFSSTLAVVDLLNGSFQQVKDSNPSFLYSIHTVFGAHMMLSSWRIFISENLNLSTIFIMYINENIAPPPMSNLPRPRSTVYVFTTHL